MGQTARARPNVARRAGRPVKYRLKIAMGEQNELEKLPLELALKVEKHLAQMAELAGEASSADPLWLQQTHPESGFLRFELGGFCVVYRIEPATESVVVWAIKRLASATTP